MEEIIKKLIEEKSQVDTRRIKLHLFLESEKASTVSAKQLSLLNIQSSIMNSYSQVLLERLQDLMNEHKQ
jgi:hypothetical protein